MPVESVRGFESWMHWVERSLRELRSAPGRAVMLEVIERDTGGGGTGGDTRTPAAPAAVTYQSGLYVDDNGVTRASLSVNFTSVTLATDGTAISVDRYELWGRQFAGTGTEPPWVVQAVTRGTALVVRPYPPGETWQFRLRAIGASSATPGEFSPETFVTFVVDTVAPPVPSPPQVSVVSGVFHVRWDGLDAAGNPMPADFSHLEIAVGTASSPTAFTGRRMRGAGSETFTGATYGTTWYFRFLAVDVSGNQSQWSANGSGKATPLVDIQGISLEETLLAQEQAAQNAADAAAVARGRADAAAADADLAQEEADAAQAAADAAEDDYLAERTTQTQVLKNETGKTTVLWQANTPTGSTSTLWVDMNTSTAKTWNGSAWVVLSGDPEVDAALAAVFDALSTWNQLQAVADTQQQEANAAAGLAATRDAEADAAEVTARDALEDATAAYQSARGTSKITYATTVPTTPYTGAAGDTWFRRNATGQVIGVWEWSGSAWTARPVHSDVLANLDVGKLTAGAATLNTAVAQKFAAETAEFLRARAEWFQATKIQADWLGVGQIKAQHIGVGEVVPDALAFGLEEFAPNPMWMDTAMRVLFPAGTGMAYVNTPALLQRGQTFALSVPPGAARVMPLSTAMPVAPGERFFLRMESQHTGANWAVSLGLEFYSATDTLLSTVLVPASAADGTGLYRPYEDVIEAPSGAASARLVLSTPVGTTGTWTVSAVSWRRVMSSVGLLGQRLEISPSAIRLWYQDEEGDPSVDIGTTGSNVITLRDPVTDLSVITLDSTGGIQAKRISASDSFSYRGQEITEALNGPKGVMARMDFARMRATTGNISTELDLAEVSFDTPLGSRREYRVQVDHVGVGASSRETVFILRATTDGTAVTNTSPEIQRMYIQPESIHRTFTFGREYSWEGNKAVRVRLSIAPGGGGTGNVEWRKYDGASLSVLDEGPFVPRSGGYASGGSTTTVLKTYTSAETARKWDQSYKGDGTQYTYDASKNYQGYYLAGNGVLKTAIGAPDQMFTDLAGATVNWIRVRLYADHWQNNGGGTAAIGVHASANKETTFPGITGSHHEAFKRDELKWVYMPAAWLPSFKSGAYRGITIHADNSTSSTFYGYFSAVMTLWQWNYTK